MFFLCPEITRKFSLHSLLNKIEYWQNESNETEVQFMSSSSSIMYPDVCRESIDRIVRITGVSVETAYAMMLTTAALMDLRPEDEKVVRMILTDCGYPEG